VFLHQLGACSYADRNPYNLISSYALQVIVTRWGADPFSLGSYAMMPPGSSPDDMAALAAPVNDVLFFAGEAMSASNQGTVHGAYATGQDAAQAVLKAHSKQQQQVQQQQQQQQQDQQLGSSLLQGAEA
jgi:hypothetical protein